MNFLKMKTSWSNWELALFKLSIASVSVLVGSYFEHFISEYYVPIIVLFVVSTITVLYLWLQKMKKK